MTELHPVRPQPYPLGAHPVNDSTICFSYIKKYSSVSGCGVILYDRASGRQLMRLPFGDDERIGNIYCKTVTDLDPYDISYLFYEGEQLVPDPHARLFTGKYTYGRERALSEWRAVLPRGDFDWQGDTRPRVPYRDSIVYLAHVRGFTRHTSSGVAHRGTFAGMTEKLDYLRESGITTVELQPAYEFAEIATEAEREQTAQFPAAQSPADAEAHKRLNYWGYKAGYYYAPKAGYSASEDCVTEFKTLVHEMHRRGLELVMQFYFPREVSPLEIPDILRFWVLEYHVDGFRLMGEDLPVELIARDALLADTKIWHTFYDADKLYAKNEHPETVHLAAYQDDYLYTMRRFLKGDDNLVSPVLEQLRRIPDKLGRIHYLTNYSGFTMMDLVSYDRKHNEANGEDNRDGNDSNCSWNCGEEGTSRRKRVRELRRRQYRNALALLMLTGSTPLIFMGDEFGNSQRGNNNPYCQDNAVTWLDWRDLEKNADLYEFWLKMVRLRREHPIFHPAHTWKVMDALSCGYPDLSFHGANAWRPSLEAYSRQVGIMYCGKYAHKADGQEDDFFYLGINMYWEPQRLALPKLPKGMRWKRLWTTGDEPVDGAEPVSTEPEAVVVTVGGRCIDLYVGVVTENADEGKGKRGTAAERYSDRTAF